MTPALRELLACVLAGALLIVATAVRLIPAPEAFVCGSDEECLRVCGSDEECVRICVRQGNDPERCADVLGNDDNEDEAPARFVRI